MTPAPAAWPFGRCARSSPWFIETHADYQDLLVIQ